MKDPTKPEGASSSMTMIHQNAAAIDIGATMHMAAVSPDRSSEPVRSFGAFTAGRRVRGMRRQDSGDGIDQRLLDSDFRTA